MNLTGRPIFQKGSDTPKPKAGTVLRKAARGQRCTLRLPCCNHAPETTVLAHIRRFGWAGMGQKPPDILAVFACSACHDALDGRSQDRCSDADLLRALGETLLVHLRDGNLTVSGK